MLQIFENRFQGVWGTLYLDKHGQSDVDLVR